MPSRFSQSRADAFAGRLDVGLDTGVCLACLGMVCMTMDGGEPAKIRGSLRAMTPELWMDGLAEPALAAVRAARDRGDPDAQAASRSSNAEAAAARLRTRSCGTSRRSCDGGFAPS